MTTEHQINIAHSLLSTGLVKKVYHSCSLVEHNGVMVPAYQQGTEWIYAGIDDTQSMFAYIRGNGDIISRSFPVAGCSKSYDISAPLRIVVYQQSFDQDFNFAINKLAIVGFGDNATLVKVIEDKWRLRREESQLWQPLAPQNFYVAFDVVLNFVLLPGDCTEHPCKIYPNPVCI